MTYEEWVQYHKKPGAGISTVRYQNWLLKGCPICGCKEWQLTSDGWAYCDGCAKDYSTYSAWTNKPLEHFDENGYHCFMCKGHGFINGERCDICGGRVTQP